MVGRYEFINRHVDDSAIQRHRAQHDERRSVARKFHLPGTDRKIQVSQIACQLLCLYLLLTGAGVLLCCFRRCSPLLCPSLPLLPFCFRLLVCVCPSVLLFCFASAYLICVRFGQGLCKLLLQHSRRSSTLKILLSAVLQDRRLVEELTRSAQRSWLVCEGTLSSSKRCPANGAGSGQRRDFVNEG